MGSMTMSGLTNSAVAACFFLELASAAVATNGQTEFPPLETASEAVRKVFDVRNIRPLRRSSFEPLRKYFSAKQRKNIDEFLHALDDLIALRNRLAEQVGIKQEWWWPPDIDIEVHLVMKNDPLTDRATSPDELRISAPELLKAKLAVTVKEVYKETAQDGTDLGGTKTTKVTLVPEHRRWVIDGVVFEVRQYGKTNTVTLTQILAQETKQLRSTSHKIANRQVEIRSAQPVSKH
jgi:hypothetical protein